VGHGKVVLRGRAETAGTAVAHGNQSAALDVMRARKKFNLRKSIANQATSQQTT
jgi:hypothetical protein